jgi:hypothetical protein
MKSTPASQLRFGDQMFFTLPGLGEYRPFHATGRPIDEARGLDLPAGAQEPAPSVFGLPSPVPAAPFHNLASPAVELPTMSTGGAAPSIKSDLNQSQIV